MHVTRAALVLGLMALSTSDARAQRSCVLTCDGEGNCVRGCEVGEVDSYSGPSPEDIARIQAEHAARVKADVDAAIRSGHAAREARKKELNVAGVAAANKKQWKKAVNYFEGVLRLDPSDGLAQKNLVDTRALADAEAAEIRRLVAAAAAEKAAAEAEAAKRAAVRWRLEKSPRLTAKQPVRFPEPPSPITNGRLDRGHSMAPEVHDFMTDALSALREQATEELTGAIEAERDEWLDYTTPQGMWWRVQWNTVQLARTIPQWIEDAATGKMTAEEAVLLDKRAALAVIDMGQGSVALAQRMLETRSADEGVKKYVEDELEEVIHDGIVPLATGLGATLHYPEGAPIGNPRSLWDSVLWQEMRKELTSVGTVTLFVTDVAMRLEGKWAPKAVGAEP
jgi:tetratricopeptide (TPR) repeat protein